MSPPKSDSEPAVRIFNAAFAFNDGSVFPNTSEGLIGQLHTAVGGQILTVLVDTGTSDVRSWFQRLA